MPLFRWHRGSLADALKTTVIIKSRLELRKIIAQYFLDIWKDHPATKERIENFKIIIKIPGKRTLQESFDSKCGWYTHYVLNDISKEGEFCVCGFLSEPLEE